MSKSVIIELDEIGRPTIEGVGFTGTTCDEHLKPFVDGFRDPKASAPLEVHKPERARSARSTITAKAKAHQR